MIPQSKRARPVNDMSQLTPADREALERVAFLLHKPLSELLGEGSHDKSTLTRGPVDIPRAKDVDHTDFQPWAAPPTQREDTNSWQHGVSGAEMDGYTPFAPPRASNRLSGTFLRAEEPYNDLSSGLRTDTLTQTSHVQIGDERYAGGFEDFHTLYNLELDLTGSWSHEARFPAAGTGMQTELLTGTDVLDGLDDATGLTIPQPNTKCKQHINSSAIGTQDDPFPMNAPSSKRSVDSTDLTSNNLVFTASDDLPDSDESEPLNESDSWEDLRLPRTSGTESQLASSAGSTSSDWSLIEMVEGIHSRSHDSFEKSSHVDNSKSHLQWIDSSSKESSSRKPLRRGPFQDKQLQEETSETRRRKACVRCRMQKIRCQMNSNDPNGECLTCQAVSKQKIHTLPCRRYMITECTLFRTGKAPGMEFTFRWPVMKLKDISDWAETEVRTISIKSDVCPIPLDVSVRKFVPIPQDSLHKGWMDGKVKKFKEVTPFAIVNMSAAVKDMREHINTHVFQCMAFFLEGKDTLIRETYAFARRYMTTAPKDEGLLLGNFFRLWFAIRRTATTEHIVGEDTIDMVPETKDTSYPLFGKIPLPPVMIQQLDMILTLGLLQPLRKKVLEDLHKIVVANKPKSWMAVYLITFMFLHSCAALSDENYKNARKHGLRRRYAMPTFISELHHGSNVFLTHYHYCTKPCDPFTIDWRSRQSTPFAEMTTDEIHFLIRTSELVKERKDWIRRANQIDLYEDDLYFVSQMFEEDWTPRDTVIDYDGGTVADVPLRRFYQPKQ